ncbi:MAG: hypothetical protein WDW36_001447 [Sanguina aurantia]
MAALLLTSDREIPDRVRTYNPDALREMLLGSARPTSERERVGAHHGLHAFMIAKSEAALVAEQSLRGRGQAQRAARQLDIQDKYEQFKLNTQRKHDELERAKDEKFFGDYEEVLAGLDSSQGIMSDTAYSVARAAHGRAKKVAELYDEWDKKVFGKIQERLQQRVRATSPAVLETRLKHQMDQYLHTSNTKLGVFRDVIIEADYDPLSVHNNTIRIPTGDIRDPLKRDMLKPQHERTLMGLSSPADTQPLGKSTLDVRSWGGLHIVATPHGHCVDKTGNYIIRPLSATAALARQSRIPMDHYTFPTGYEAVAAELPRGKGIPPSPEDKRGTNLFDIMQNTCNARPDVTGGDVFLEAKGRAAAAGPEVRRGRKDLRHIIQQTPYDGRSLGDSWLEAKGRQQVDGPEVLRGRPTLFNTIQQQFPPNSTAPSGDRWLEAKGRR